MLINDKESNSTAKVKFIFQLTLFRFGVSMFECRLNAALDEGWKLESWDLLTVGFFRVMLWAKLTKAV